MAEHPLNDGKCMSLFSFERLLDASQPITVEDSMRAAADWQLGEVIKWLRENLGLIEPDRSVPYLKNISYDEWKIISDLKETMRPTQQQENNFS